MTLTNDREQQLALFHTFQTALTSLEGETRMISAEELPRAVAEIIAEEKIARLVVTAPLFLKSGSLSRFLPPRALTVHWMGGKKAADFDERSYRRILAEADAAISSANYLIAETGSVLFLNKDHPAKLATILPPSLIIVAELNALIATLNELVEALKVSETAPKRSFFCISGPSRTADIEKILVLGVHGPKRLHVLVVDRGRNKPPAASNAENA